MIIQNKKESRRNLLSRASFNFLPRTNAKFDGKPVAIDIPQMSFNLSSVNSQLFRNYCVRKLNMMKSASGELILLLILACSMTIHSQTRNHQEEIPKDLLITLDLSREYRPPPKTHLTVTIESDSTVSFNVLLPAERQTVKTIKLTQEQLEDLVAEIRKTDFFSLDNNYSPEDGNCDGLPLAHRADKILSVRFNSQIKSVRSIAGCVGKNGSGLEKFDRLTDKIVGLRGQTSETKPDLSKSVIKVDEKQCSVQQEGIEFCLVSSFVPVKSGESVPIVFAIRNKTKNPITLKRRVLDELFDIQITDSSGTKVLSFKEILEKKVREKTATDEELIRALPIYSGPGFIVINPEQEIKTEYNLGFFYDFSAKGKYSVEFRKKDIKESQNYIGKMTIEIK